MPRHPLDPKYTTTTRAESEIWKTRPFFKAFNVWIFWTDCPWPSKEINFFSKSSCWSARKCGKMAQWELNCYKWSEFDTVVNFGLINSSTNQKDQSVPTIKVGRCQSVHDLLPHFRSCHRVPRTNKSPNHKEWPPVCQYDALVAPSACKIDSPCHLGLIWWVTLVKTFQFSASSSQAVDCWGIFLGWELRFVLSGTLPCCRMHGFCMQKCFSAWVVRFHPTPL